MLNEVRFGWMDVSGGQTSVNRGSTSPASVGLHGVTSDPRDVGFPQISTGGLVQHHGRSDDFITRNNQHFELYDNVTIDRGAHRLKFGATTTICSFGPSSRTTLEAPSPIPGSSAAMRSRTFCSGTRRRPRQGSAAAMRTASRTGCTSTRRTIGARDNLTVNLGLRYEYNQHMHDVGQPPVVDRSVTPGGRYVIASDDNGAINPRRRRCSR